MLGLIAIIENDEAITGIPLPLCDRHLKLECFADDTSLFIGHHDDYDKYRNHIMLFERASTMRTNWHKTIGMLLGHYAINHPDFSIGSDMEWITYKESTRVLGIMVGPTNHPQVNWVKTISKVRKFIHRTNPSLLTISGRIIIANSCIIGCAIFNMSHSYVSISDATKLKSIVNQYTNAGKQVSMVSYEDKIKPLGKGGPMHLYPAGCICYAHYPIS